jgi:signal transduction histidine kinase
VDDDHLTRGLLYDALQTEGYNVVTAVDGAAGVQLAEAHAPDLIVADVNMPGLDGFQLLERIRRSPNTSMIPVVFLTAENSPTAVRKGMVGGAEDFLAKPVSVADLLSSVKTQLQKRAVLDEKHNTTMRLLRRSIMYALPHELRSPLHLISGFAKLIEMEQGKTPPEDLLTYARSISEASYRLERLFENYLVYAQVELISADPVELEAVRNHLIKDCGAVIASAASDSARRAGRVDDLHLDVCHLALRISEKNLAKVITELVDNAFKFSQPGSPVWVRSTRDNDLLFIVISDLGRGMTMEQISLLGAYMQFGRDLYEQQGIGLGFAVAKRIIELHEGAVKVESQVECGTTISIRFSLY